MPGLTYVTRQTKHQRAGIVSLCSPRCWHSMPDPRQSTTPDYTQPGAQCPKQMARRAVRAHDDGNDLADAIWVFTGQPL